MREYFNGKPMNDGSFGEIYSTEEICIGTWINGKPLYRRGYKFTTPQLVVNVSQWPVIGTIYNVDEVVSISSTLRMSGGGTYADMISLFFDHGVSRFTYAIRATDDSSVTNYSNRPGTAIILYTKTTDKSTFNLQPGTQIDVLLPDITSEASSAKLIEI